MRFSVGVIKTAAVVLSLVSIAGCGGSGNGSGTSSVQLLALPSGSRFALANAMSMDGSTIVGSIGPDPIGAVATIWRGANNPVVIDPPFLNQGSQFMAVSPSGNCAAGSYYVKDENGHELQFPMMWSRQTGMVALPTPPDYSYLGIGYLIIGDNGAVSGMVNLAPSNGDAALYSISWSPDRTIANVSRFLNVIDFPIEKPAGATVTLTTSASENGQYAVGDVVLTQFGQPVTEACIWNSFGTPTLLGSLNSAAVSYSMGYGVSNDGTVAYGSVSSEQNPANYFVWTAKAGMQEVLTYVRSQRGAGAEWTAASLTALSPDGKHAAGTGTANGQRFGFVVGIK